jgi:hypothetical protein
MTMRTFLAACLLTTVAAGAAFADDDDQGAKKSKMKFWNLTGVELVEVVLAPAGTDKFGDNQTLNDDNKSIENDERLPLTGLAAGTYDVRIKDKSGRVCLVKGVEVKEGTAYAFSLEPEQLTDCKG